jgi:hypothetical protein
MNRIHIMFKKIIPLLSVLFLVSCSNDSSNVTDPCKVTSVKTLTFLMDDVNMSTNYNPTFSGKVSFEYDTQNRISKVHGGLKGFPSGQFMTYGWTFYNDVDDVITYQNDTIIVDYSSNQQLKPYLKEFVINSNHQVVYKKVKASYTTFTAIDEYTYEYNGDEVLENKNGLLYRTFTMENGNLTKIEQIKRNAPTGDITGKKEILFFNYDDKPNLVKGKYYINGLFYKAFCTNNYQRVDTNEYSYVNNEYVPGNFGYWYFTLQYDIDDVANIFERMCQ